MVFLESVAWFGVVKFELLRSIAHCTNPKPHEHTCTSSSTAVSSGCLNKSILSQAPLVYVSIPSYRKPSMINIVLTLKGLLGEPEAKLLGSSMLHSSRAKD